MNGLLDGPNRKFYAVQWSSSQPDREEIARRVSPLACVRTGLPPILTVHGDADAAVPWAHAARLRDAMQKAGSVNELMTIPGAKRGGFTTGERLKILDGIRAFLKRQGIGLKRHIAAAVWRTNC